MGIRLSSIAALVCFPSLCCCAASERAQGGAAVGTQRIVHPEDVRRLQGVTRLVGDLVLERANVESLRGLSLEAVTGDVVVRANAALRSLDGLERLASVGGRLLVEENPHLQGFFELASLRKVGGEVRITDNGALPVCEALALEAQMHLPEGAAVEISGNADRPACAGDVVVEDESARDAPTL
jgi:hypothetical protein